MSNPIRLVLIEDHELTRVGLKAMLETYPDLEVVGEAATGTEGLAIVQATLPDLAVIDIGLPDIDGIEVTRQLKEWLKQTPNAETKVLILTLRDDEKAVLTAFAAGADSYTIKDVGVDRLLEAIYATQEGQAWIDPAIAHIVLHQAQQSLQRQSLHQRAGTIEEPSSPSIAETLQAEGKVLIDAVQPEYEHLLSEDLLTERELEVLEHIVAGYSNGAIAEQLHITLGTVKTHVRSILDKLSAADRTQAAVRALRSGLVP